MTNLDEICAAIRCALILVLAATFAVAAPLFAQAAAAGDKSQASRLAVQDECRFLDGGTISFGRKASGSKEPVGVWHVGNYEATALRVSERMLIPPMTDGLEIPPGSYTLFVDRTKGIPWTLIVSKKTGEPSMPYPGEQYDVGRTQMGSDVSSQPIDTFTIGCIQTKDGFIFVQMQSGSDVAYTKLVTVKTQQGKTEYSFR
jgi:hypothetical protein